MDIKYIGRNIAKLRISRGLSQGDLGKEIGLTPSAISNKDIEQLGELQLKSKLLTTEMFLRSGKPQRSLSLIHI